ncbi:MAG: hypothetical protein IPO15_21310 [Anaerolineae bacterium]|uniref:TaqI-like C-terminal specificity domain-containing protein n=1 Tax=Candidatus Amarolinea dominans TaxID=3140696 RepID=UPI0031371EC8|nr:hypothetical protein [Anaerolineae bacterium]
MASAMFWCDSSDLWNRIRGKGRPLGELADVNFGKQLRDRSVFLQDVIQLAPGMPTPLTHRLCYTGRDVTRVSTLECKVGWPGLNSEFAAEPAAAGWREASGKNKLLTRQIGTYPVFALDPMGYDCLNTMFMVNLHPSAYSAYYILGLLNSKLLDSYLAVSSTTDQRRTFRNIRHLPRTTPHPHHQLR